MILKDLIEADKKGYEITFDIVNHRNVPNTVCLNGACWGNISLSTIKAFRKYKKSKN